MRVHVCFTALHAIHTGLSEMNVCFSPFRSLHLPSFSILCSILQVRVVQGKEPVHFRSLFKGAMLIHEGGKASGFKNSTEEDKYDDDGVSLCVYPMRMLACCLATHLDVATRVSFHCSLISSILLHKLGSLSIHLTSVVFLSLRAAAVTRVSVPTCTKGSTSRARPPRT
jgi:hypothetical protein